MSKVLTTKTKLYVKQTCSLIAGVLLCVYIFIPLFSSLSARLFLLVAPKENLTLVHFTWFLLEAIAFCVSGFFTGLIISFFSTDREIRTTVLGSLITTAFVLIRIGFVPLRLGASEVHKAWRLLEMVIYAMCLLGLAITGAWLIERRRFSQVQKTSKGN